MSRLILVTGGSRGIGAASAVMAAKRGYAVAVNYQSNEKAARSVCAEIEQQGGLAFALQGDVATSEGVRRLFDALDSIDLPLTGLVNNAGVVGQIMPFDAYTDTRLEQTIAVNVLGAMRCAREAIKRMLGHQLPSAIVNVSSAAARLGSPNEFIDYAASKGAVDTLTVGLSKEYGDRGIRVNAVRPGLILTEIHAAAGDASRVERFTPMIPMQRPGSAEEVASTIVWLLSEDSSYVSGALLDVAGGR